MEPKSTMCPILKIKQMGPRVNLGDYKESRLDSIPS